MTRELESRRACGIPLRNGIALAISVWVSVACLACAMFRGDSELEDRGDASDATAPFVDLDFPWDYYTSAEFRRAFELALPETEARALAGLADRVHAWSWYKLLLMLDTPATMPWPESIRWPEVDDTVRHFACGAPRAWRRTGPLQDACSRVPPLESDRVLQPLADAMTAYLGFPVLLDPELTSDTGCWHCERADVRVLSTLVSHTGNRMLAELYVDFGLGRVAGNQTWIVALRGRGESWVLSRAWLEAVE